MGLEDRNRPGGVEPNLGEVIMSDVLKSKHVLGGLTLRDLKQKINELRLWSVEIDGELYEKFVFYAKEIEIWSTEEHYEHDEPAARAYDLDYPAKVKDGKVIVTDPETGVEEVLVFGKTEFVPTKIEIL